MNAEYGDKDETTSCPLIQRKKLPIFCDSKSNFQEQHIHSSRLIHTSENSWKKNSQNLATVFSLPSLQVRTRIQYAPGFLRLKSRKKIIHHVQYALFEVQLADDAQSFVYQLVHHTAAHEVFRLWFFVETKCKGRSALFLSYVVAFRLCYVRSSCAYRELVTRSEIYAS